MIKDEMVGYHHQLDGHELEQTLGDSEGWGMSVLDFLIEKMFPFEPFPPMPHENEPSGQP